MSERNFRQMLEAKWAEGKKGKFVCVGLDTEFLPRGGARVAAQTASLEDLLKRLEADEFDLVGVGRALLANPDWAELVQKGDQAALKPYSADTLRQLY